MGGWCPSQAHPQWTRWGYHGPSQALCPPVRMFLKASSTLVESKAEVSMKDKLFFSGTE